MYPRAISVVSATLAIIVTARSADAAELFVPQQYSSIQGAINAAQNGDEIIVAAGTYNETIDLIGKAITLRSASGAENTIIDGSGYASSVVKCVNGETIATVLDGFTITGGSGTLENSRRKGGGMFNKFSSPTIRNCTFKGNTVRAYESDISGSGAGMYNEYSNPVVADTTFKENGLLGCLGWENGGGAMYNDNSNPEITNSTFVDNRANNGGGIMNVHGSNPHITSSVFTGNDATFSGGGINNTNGANATIVNSIFSQNTAYHGAGVYAYSADITLVNNTLHGNVADRTAGGLYLLYANGTPTVANNIFWSNEALEEPADKEVLREGGATATIEHNTIDGEWNGIGSNNGSGDPTFIDAENGDFRLHSSSPCVNEGNNASLPSSITVDLAGGARIFQGIVDHGAYENQEQATLVGDLNSDGVVDVNDLLNLIAAWGICPAKSACVADIDGNARVDVDDLLILVGNWG